MVLKGKHEKKYLVTFTKATLKQILEFLLRNYFFQHENKVFLQGIGSCSIYFLYYYDNKYIIETKNADTRRVRHFGNSFRFLNDLTVINVCDEFERSILEIYPPWIGIKQKKSLNFLEKLFLDLMITIKDIQIVYQVL